MTELSIRPGLIRVLARQENRWLVPLMLAIVLCPVSAMLVDPAAASFMRAQRESWVVDIAEVITDYGDAWPYLLGTAIIFVVSYLFGDVTLLGKTALLRVRALYIFVTMAVSILAGEAVAIILGRPRPHLLLDHGLDDLSWLEGFKPFDSMPSSHATAALAFSFAAALAFRPARWAFIGYGMVLASTSGAIALFLQRYLNRAERAAIADDDQGFSGSAFTPSAPRHAASNEPLDRR
jgi:membrane-associated phospholipid phosphatase